MALPAELTAEGLLGFQERHAVVPANLKLTRFFKHIPNMVSGHNVAWQLWDHTRELATVMPYNAKGENIAMRDREHKSSVAPTTREWKDIPGEYIQWLMAPDNETQAMGQRVVTGELNDLVGRIHRRHEAWRAQIFTDTLTFTQAGHTISVTVGLPAAHTADAGATWATSSNDIIGDVAGWKELIQQASGVTPDLLLCNPDVIPHILNNDQITLLLGDREKTQLQAGVQTRIPGLDIDVDSYGDGYHNSSGTFVPYIASETCVLFSTNPEESGLAFVDCSSNDARAGPTHRGLFTHSWEDEQPPAGVNVSAEHTGMPVCMNPESIFYCTDVTP